MAGRTAKDDRVLASILIFEDNEENRYYIEVLPDQFQIIRKYIGKDKREKEQEYEVVEGYYQTLKGAVKRLQDRFVGEQRPDDISSLLIALSNSDTLLDKKMDELMTIIKEARNEKR